MDNRYLYETIRGVEGHVPEEFGTLFPVTIGSGGYTSRDSLNKVVCHSVESIMETILLGGFHSHLGSICG